MRNIPTELIEHVAYLYYEKNWRQNEIAEALRISKSRVSRLIDRAKDLGIARIKVVTTIATDVELEQRLIQLAGLQNAVVARVQEYNDIQSAIGAAAASYLTAILKDGDILGVAIGRTVSSVIDQLRPDRAMRIRVVQLMGGFGDVAQHNPLTLVNRVCDKFKCSGEYASVPAVVANNEERLLMLQSSAMEKVKLLWGSCDVILAGMSAVDDTSLFVRTGLLKEGDMLELRSSGARCSILGHFLDFRGNIIDLPLSKRIVSISWTDIQAAGTTVAVGGGSYKVHAIASLLRANGVDVLITDSETARAVITIIEEDIAT